MNKTNQPNIARGGKTVYGGTVGICMLDTRFPRIPGDIEAEVTLNVSYCAFQAGGRLPEVP